MAEKEYQELTAQIDGLRKLIIAGSKEVLSIEECATFTSLSVAHIYRLTSQRAIPFYKPMGGKIYFKKSEIDDGFPFRTTIKRTTFNGKSKYSFT